MKLWSDAAEALRGVVADGQTIAVGGFGLCGNPSDLIEALRDSGVRDLTVVSNNMGVDGVALMYRTPVDLYLDEWVYDLLDTVERTGATRVAIDSLGDLRVSSADELCFRE